MQMDLGERGLHGRRLFHLHGFSPQSKHGEMMLEARLGPFLGQREMVRMKTNSKGAPFIEERVVKCPLSARP